MNILQKIWAVRRRIVLVLAIVVGTVEFLAVTAMLHLMGQTIWAAATLSMLVYFDWIMVFGDVAPNPKEKVLDIG